MLSFHRQILDEVASPDHDDLLILAKGLGLRRIVCQLMRIYDSPNNLILLINATPAEETGIGELLSTLGVRRPGMRVLTHEMTSKERNELYLQGGLFSVTSRILVVDLLTKNVPPEMITGLLVLHAELVNQTSLEAFIVRLYRQTNHEGFLKAFSDEPESFSSTMTPLTTCLKQLSLRRVTLWPRFREEVHTSLGQRKADVIELYQPLTKMMNDIQVAIVECMEVTLAEVRKACTGVDLDELTIDNAMFKSFDRIVRGRLDSIWHKVGPKTRRLVQDLSTLRNLLNYLLAYDAISFNSHLEAILSSSSSMTGGSAVTGNGAKRRPDQSPWLYLDAANTLFHVAKRRAYIPPPSKKQQTAVQQANAEMNGEEDEMDALREVERLESQQASSARVSASRWPPGVEPVLEELPKWGLLASILEEAEAEIEALKREARPDMPGSNTILVMTSSERTSSQLREYLSTREAAKANTADDKPSQTAGKGMMERLLTTYFWWKGSLGEMARNSRGGVSKASTSQGGNNGAGPSQLRSVPAPRGQPAFKRRRIRGGGSVGGSASTREDEKALVGDARDEGLEYEAETIADFLHASSQQTYGEESSAAGPSSARRSDTPAPAFFDQPSMARSVTPAPLSLREGSEVPEIRRLESEAPSVADPPSQTPAPQSLLRPSAQSSATDYFDPEGFDSYFGLLEPEDMVVVRNYKGDDEDQILEELRPRFIIMYDCDPAFVRRVEVYRSSKPGLGVRVYFMMYVNSAEESKYLSSVTKEKLAFERLIREKGSMIIPITGDPRGAPAAPTSRIDTLAKAISTRIAGGAQEQQVEPPTVIVDMREFRSTLPSLLHASNMLIIPVTLQVGDYILSPDMCVERKSIPDLIQSFNSGRLYTQCETMSVHYKLPILLIEFEENKSFSLQTMAETKRPSQFQSKKDVTPREDTISEHEIQSKLVLLTLTFPRLRIIWSSSPFATASIVADLKHKHQEPSVEKAILVGQGDDSTEGDASGSNGAAIELLRLIPGVSARNLRHVINNIKSVKHMCSLTKAELELIMGAEPGALAYNFLHHDVQQRAARPNAST